MQQKGLEGSCCGAVHISSFLRKEIAGWLQSRRKTFEFVAVWGWRDSMLQLFAATHYLATILCSLPVLIIEPSMQSMVPHAR